MNIVKLKVCLQSLLLCAAWALPGRAALAPRTDINPALLYWQAFSLFPNLSEADSREIYADPPVLTPEEARKFTSKYDASFTLVRRAAHSTALCDWGIDLADGPHALMPNLIKVRQTVNVAMFRAHYALEEGRASDATEDIVASYYLGRRAGVQGTLVSTMIGVAVENKVIDFIASHFHLLTPETLVSLSRELEAAPARATIREAMKFERATFGDWLVNKVEGFRAAHPGDDLAAVADTREMLRQTLSTDPKKKDDTVERIIAAAGGTSRGLIAYLHEIDPIYNEVFKVTEAPPESLEAETQRCKDLLETHPNLLVRLIMPAVGRARAKELETTARLALLRAGMAQKAHGKAAFNQVTDPFGTGPFTMISIQNGRGFELRSKLAEFGLKGTLAFSEPMPTTAKTPLQ